MQSQKTYAQAVHLGPQAGVVNKLRGHDKLKNAADEAHSECKELNVDSACVHKVLRATRSEEATELERLDADGHSDPALNDPTGDGKRNDHGHGDGNSERKRTTRQRTSSPNAASKTHDGCRHAQQLLAQREHGDGDNDGEGDGKPLDAHSKAMAEPKDRTHTQRLPVQPEPQSPRAKRNYESTDCQSESNRETLDGKALRDADTCAPKQERRQKKSTKRKRKAPRTGTPSQTRANPASRQRA